jgi:(4S)-4-hydroxy-5-phosphonooxypentane-2,3-dione isomerase
MTGREEDSSVFVLIVSLTVHPDAVDEFRSAIAANAAASVRDEPGCSRFDVVELDGNEHRFALYEIYDDAAAFEAHKQTQHFAAWRKVADRALSEQVNRFGTLIVAAATP